MPLNFYFNLTPKILALPVLVLDHGRQWWQTQVYLNLFINDG